jgi:hypothetical protein
MYLLLGLWKMRNQQQSDNLQRNLVSLRRRERLKYCEADMYERLYRRPIFIRVERRNNRYCPLLYMVCSNTYIIRLWQLVTASQIGLPTSSVVGDHKLLVPPLSLVFRC